MSKLETKEKEKEWTNIDYTNTTGYKTVKAWNKIAGIYEKGGSTGVTSGIPRDEFRQLQKLRQFDSKVKPDKGPVQKIITSIHRQLVSLPDKDGRLVHRECLTLAGRFRGLDWAEMPLDVGFTEGWFKKPTMGKVYESSNRFDPETGEDLGKINVKGTEFEYYYELPQSKTERKKYIDDIIAKANGTFAENIKWYYKETSSGIIPSGGQRDDTFSYEDMTELSIQELRSLSKRGGGSKGPGVYRDSDGKLRDRNNNLVSKPDDGSRNKKGKEVYQ